MIGGLLLGPSLLGRVAPTLSGYILPPAVAPFLGVLSQVGVVLYMFLVGTELDLSRIRHRVHSTVARGTGGQTRTVTRMKVAGMDVPPAVPLFWLLASSRSWPWSASTLPLF